MMDSDFESGSESDTESYCDSLSSDSYDGTDNWPLHADCKLDQEENQWSGSWLISPRTLSSQCAVQFVLHGTIAQLTRQEIPANLYPTLLCEACRVRNMDMVCHIVANWPFTLLNLNSLEVPLDAMGSYFTKAWGKQPLSLAGMIVKGLLELNPTSKLKRVVLPDSECEGSEILRLFTRLPLLALKHVPRKHLISMINKQLKLDLDISFYLQSVPVQPFTASKNTLQRTEPLTIMVPGVIQWLGKHCNYRDVMVGLALQAYVPIQFCFEKLVFYNAVDLTFVNRILEICALPEKTKKLIINNRKRADAVHILLKVGALHHVLQRYSKIEAFLCKFDGMYVTSPMGNIQLALERSAACFSSWKCLRDINLSGNYLATKLGQLLIGLETPLIKLNVSATGLQEQDIKFLAESKHVASLQYLNLDYIDLSTTFNQQRTRELFSKMTSLVYLRTCCTRLSYGIAVSFAEHLQHLDTLTHWNLLQNQFGLLDELVRFIKTASHIKNLKELGCKPFELHALFASLYVQSVGPPALTDSERLELNSVAERFGITVY